MDMQLYIDSFLKPGQTFAAQKANADLGKGVMNFAIGGLISGVVMFILFAITSLAQGNILGLVVGAVYIVAMPILVVILELIFLLVPFVLSKLAGGTGSYTSLFYLTSLYSVVALALSAIPMVGFFVSLYTIYLFYLVVKESQGLSQNRALVVVLVPLILAIIVAALVVVLGIATLDGLAAATVAQGSVPIPD